MWTFRVNYRQFTPGGRGLLREVWLSADINNDLTLENIEAQPRSSKTTVEERIYRDHADPRDFNEGGRFAQRLSGFFVPPLDSLYTFNIRSDDQSRLYLSKTSSPNDKEEIATNIFHTGFSWDRYEFQFSEPIYLTAGELYYIEYLQNEYGGIWDYGIGVKIHNLTMTRHPYIADMEVQRIEISSTVTQEQHVS